MTVFLTLILKNLTEMRSDFIKLLEKRGIDKYQFFTDVAEFVHRMLMNTERGDAK